jgi:hypothetical protein
LDITGLKRTRTGAIVAQVVWDGDYEPTWEPLDHLRHCHSLVTTYATLKNVLSLLPAWFTTLADDDVPTPRIHCGNLRNRYASAYCSFGYESHQFLSGDVLSAHWINRYFPWVSPNITPVSLLRACCLFPHHQARGYNKVYSKMNGKGPESY